GSRRRLAKGGRTYHMAGRRRVTWTGGRTFPSRQGGQGAGAAKAGGQTEATGCDDRRATGGLRKGAPPDAGGRLSARGVRVGRNAVSSPPYLDDSLQTGSGVRGIGRVERNRFLPRCRPPAEGLALVRHGRSRRRRRIGTLQRQQLLAINRH